MGSENYTEIFNKLEKWLISHKFIIHNKKVNPNPRVILQGFAIAYCFDNPPLRP